MDEDHEHIWSPYVQRSRLAGTPHYPCTVSGCSVISLDGPWCDCEDGDECETNRMIRESMQ
jgi:hypothetical protein